MARLVVYDLLPSPLWAASHPIKASEPYPPPPSTGLCVCVGGGGASVSLVPPSGTYGGESRKGREGGWAGEGGRD